MRAIKDGKNYFALKIDKDKDEFKKNEKEVEKVEGVQQSNEDLYNKVKEYLKERETISVSRIQAEFCVGYPLARRILLQLIEDGLVEQVEEYKYIVKK